MNLRSRLQNLPPQDLAAFGAARARDAAFDAVRQLWDRRKSEGMKQVELAQSIGRDPGWVSKTLSGPANWTMRSFGELVAAMHGEVVISVRAIEDSAVDVPIRVEQRAIIFEDRSHRAQNVRKLFSSSILQALSDDTQPASIEKFSFSSNTQRSQGQQLAKQIGRGE